MGGNVIIVLYSHSCVCMYVQVQSLLSCRGLSVHWSGKEILILSPRLVNV